jgi:hypothetical protein
VAVGATQAVGDANHEPKMKVVPLSSTTLVKLNDSIEFSGGCSMNISTWRTSYRCFTATLTEGYPEVVSLYVGCCNTLIFKFGT